MFNEFCDENISRDTFHFLKMFHIFYLMEELPPTPKIIVFIKKKLLNPFKIKKNYKGTLISMQGTT